MIRIVADTHALVWFLFANARLSVRAREAMTVAAGDQIAISVITLIELVYQIDRTACVATERAVR